FLFRLYFFLLPPHLRTPSLFPYTTLFRSAFGDAGRDLDARSLRDLRAVHPAARAARAARRRPGRRRPRRISASRPRPLPARPPRPGPAAGGRPRPPACHRTAVALPCALPAGRL